MPFVIAAETAGEIQCLMELLKDEDIQLTIVDGFEFGDAIEELKEKKVGIIFGNFSNLSQISKHEIDLSRLKELVENGNRIAFTNTCKGASEGREVFIWSAIEVYRAGIDAEDVVKNDDDPASRDAWCCRSDRKYRSWKRCGHHNLQ